MALAMESAPYNDASASSDDGSERSSSPEDERSQAAWRVRDAFPPRLDKDEIERRRTLIDLARAFLRCNDSGVMKSLVKGLCSGQVTLTEFCDRVRTVFGTPLLQEAVREMQFARLARQRKTSPQLHRPHVQMKRERPRGPASHLLPAGVLTADLALMQRLTVSSPLQQCERPERIKFMRPLAPVQEAAQEREA